MILSGGNFGGNTVGNGVVSCEDTEVPYTQDGDLINVGGWLYRIDGDIAIYNGFTG